MMMIEDCDDVGDDRGKNHCYVTISKSVKLKYLVMRADWHGSSWQLKLMMMIEDATSSHHDGDKGDCDDDGYDGEAKTTVMLSKSVKVYLIYGKE